MDFRHVGLRCVEFESMDPKLVALVFINLAHVVFESVNFGNVDLAHVNFGYVGLGPIDLKYVDHRYVGLDL